MCLLIRACSGCLNFLDATFVGHVCMLNFLIILFRMCSPIFSPKLYDTVYVALLIYKLRKYMGNIIITIIITSLPFIVR